MNILSQITSESPTILLFALGVEIAMFLFCSLTVANDSFEEVGA